MTEQPLRAPFPWFGGKSRAAHLIWERFGDVPNYIEPFAGSLAVLLSRPTPPRIETVNDLDCYLSNFWRAVQAAPDEVAKWADWPVNEADLHARHKWLRSQEEFRAKMHQDPDYYDAKIAGWWVWGVSTAIGGAGVFCQLEESPRYGSPPTLHHAGNGIGGSSFDFSVFGILSHRLRRTRVCSGDWTRVLSNTPLSAGAITGVFLDPPYSEGRFAYAGLGDGDTDESDAIAQSVARWAIDHGKNPTLRIAYCGLEGTVQFPDSWEIVEWKTQGGYGNQRKDKGNKNRYRERIWFSPHCLKAGQGRLL